MEEKENLCTKRQYVETGGTPYKCNVESFKSLGEISYFKNEFWFKRKLEVVMKNIRGNWKDLVKIIELTEAVIRMQIWKLPLHHIAS